MTEPAAAPAPEQAGLLDDFIDIFVSPGRMFARRATSNAFVPFLIVTVLLIGLFYASKNVMEPIFDQEISRQIATQAKANPAMTADMQEQMRKVMSVSYKWGVIVGMPIILLVLALCTWLVGKLFGGVVTYGMALMIASYAWVPRVLASVLNMVQLQITDPNKISGMAGLSFGPARFLDADATSTGLMQLAMRFDLFTLWSTVLLAVGLMYAGKVPKSKAILAGVTIFVLGSLAAIWALIKGT